MNVTSLGLIGGAPNSRRAHQILVRVREWKIDRFGRDHEETLETTSSLSDALKKMNMLDEAEELVREVYAAYRRTMGAEHYLTLQGGKQLIFFLGTYREDGLEEARGIYRKISPVVRRVLGPDHRLAQILQILQREFDL